MAKGRKQEPKQKHAFGYRRDRHDERDLKLVTPLKRLLLPRSVDLRPLLKPIPIYDQGAIGSCVANAASVAQVYATHLQNRKEGDPDKPTMRSRLFIYFNARKMIGLAHEDSGCQIRDAVKSIAVIGACSERSYPYRPESFARTPSQRIYAVAKESRITEYRRCIGLRGVKTALSLGYPVIGGFSVYANVESDYCEDTGIVKMPTQHEPCIGGHAVLFVGFDDDKKHIIFRNSWGKGWGSKEWPGHGFLPYGYLENYYLASDFWALVAGKDDND
jgi:C1A family cysteine protease